MPTAPAETFARLLATMPVVAILRGLTARDCLPVCETICEAGVRLIEMPLNAPEALECIRVASVHYGEDALIGAGTVLDNNQVDAVAEAGGRYIVAPNTNPGAIRRAGELGLATMPGFLTPTEAFAALEAGADFLKLFPARVFGPAYVKDLRAVLKAPIVAVGGVRPDNIADYLAVADGVAFGASVYRPGAAPAEVRSALDALLAPIC